MNNLINIGIPSKGRLRKDILKIFKKNKLSLVSERGERDLLGSIKQLKNVKVLYLHAREIVERLGDGSLDLGFSGYDLLKESEINIQNKINVFREAMIGKNNNERLRFFNLGSDNDYKKLLDGDLVHEMNNLYRVELEKYNYE